jgi:NitT/TauT family transport system ATP-binding protein
MKSEKVLIKNVSKYFPEKAITNINLTIYEKEIISLVGPSGCGKTTVINLIGNFLQPTEGTIFINCNNSSNSANALAVVFQGDAVFPWFNVKDNVGYGLKFKKYGEQKKAEIIEKLLNRVGLRDAADKWPKELSGGMKKRVDLARALAVNPEILLLDEPFGSLDVLTRADMQTLLLEIWQEDPKTILFVTHDPEEALFVAHRVAVMTAAPGTIKKIIDIEAKLPFPRDHSLKLSPEFLALRRQIIDELTGEPDPQAA